MTPSDSCRSVRIAAVAPRNMHFGPERATSIDLCIHDFVRHSRYRVATTVVAQAVPHAFDDVDVAQFAESNPKRGVRRILKALTPDLVVVHQHLPTALRVKRALGATPVLLHRHNFLKKPKNALSLWWKRRALARLAGIVFVSTACARRFDAEWGTSGVPIHVVENGLDPSAWRPAPVRARTILYVGRMAPEKGVLPLAQALAQVLPDTSAWTAKFIVSEAHVHANYTVDVRRALEPLGSRVEIVENKPHAVVRAAFEHAAIAVVPSLWDEPFGRTAVEAFAGGAAVIGSTRGGLAEVLGEAAVRLDAVSASTLAEALETLMQDAFLRERLGHMGRQRFERHFSIAHATAKLDEIYGALLSA